MTIIKNASDIPENINKRQNLIVLDEQTFNEAMSSYETGKFLLDDNICYLVQPSVEQIKNHPVLTKLDNKNQLKNGNILSQDYDDDNGYLIYDIAIKKTAEAQLTRFSELCQLLGAKSVTIQTTTTINQDENIEANIDTSIKAAEMNAHAKNQVINELMREMEQKTLFDGNGEQDLEKAEKLISTKYFDDNEHILSLYRMAKSQKNKIQSQKVKIRLAEKACKNLSIMANIDLPLFKKTIGSANLEKIKNVSQIIEIEYLVEFDK